MEEKHRSHTLEQCPQESRLKQIEAENKETFVKVSVMVNDIGYIKQAIDRVEGLIVEKYVLKSEFDPIKKIVYGTTGLILTTVIIALLALVVKHGQ
jgi:ABC-type phosphate transport system permease subunit